MHKLHAVDVKAREVAANSQQPCSGPMRSLRTYNLDYQNDADTGQSQLRRVTMIGQETRHERNDHAAGGDLYLRSGHGLGRQSSPTGSGSRSLTSLPSGPIPVLPLPARSSCEPRPDGSSSSTSSCKISLTSMAMAGRIFCIVPTFGPADRGAQQAGPRQSPELGLHADPFPTPDCEPGSVGYQTSPKPRQTDIDGSRNSSQVWVQMIDMNADGRVDVVVANETSNFWVVYLNKPDPQDPNSRRLGAALHRYPPAAANICRTRPEP